MVKQMIKGLTLVVLLMSACCAQAIGKQIKIYNGREITVPDTTIERCHESDD